MRVAKDDVFGGLPAAVAIPFIRLFHNGNYASDIQPRFDPQYGSERAALLALEAEGYVERRRVDSDGDIVWANTMNGNALAMAKLTPPITRASADRLVDGIVSRAETVNATPELLFSVRRLTVFGSYLDPDRERLGDVDVAVALVPRTEDVARLHAYSRSSGRSFSTYIDELDWPRQEVWNVLKNRSRGLSLTNQNPSSFTSLYRDIFTDDTVPDSPFW